jgi:hypothetical protein
VLRVRRPRYLALACLALASAGAVAGCPDATAPATYTPLTGVTLNIADVPGSPQCGTGPGEVYKYTAVVWYAAGDGGPLGAPIYSTVWDCFVSGIFDNLPAADGGNDAFYLKVYGYSYAGAQAALAEQSAEAGDGDGGDFAGLWCSGGLGPNGEPCPLQDPSTAAALGDLAQWSTACLATETEGAPVTAICAPFALLAPVVVADAGTAEGGDAASEAEANAPDVAGDAPTDATAEATTD